jgi:hypothetical protein
MGVVEALGAEEESAQLCTIQSAPFRWVHRRATNVLSWVGRDPAVDVSEAVEAAGGRETPVYGRGGQPPLLHRRAVHLKVGAAGFEHGQTVVGRPLEQVAQIMAVSVERSTAVAGPERDGCQFRRIHGALGSWKLNGRSNSGHGCSSFW